MASYLDQYKVQPVEQSPPVDTTVTTTPPATGSYLEQYKVNKGPTLPPAPDPSKASLTDSALKGYTQGLGSPVPMTGFEPPEQMQAIGDVNKDYLKKTPEQQQGVINESFPNASQSTTGKAVEKGVEGAAIGAPLGLGSAGVGALSGAVSGATGSDALGFLAGLGTGAVGNTVQKGLALGKDAFSQANKALNLPGASMAEALPENSLIRRAFNWLKGSPGGSNITEDAARSRNTAAQGVVDNLASGATKTEAGAELQTSATHQINKGYKDNTDIINDLETRRNFSHMPGLEFISPQNYSNTISSLHGTSGSAMAAPFQSPLLEKAWKGLQDELRTSSNGMLSYESVKATRSAIGDMLKRAIEGDASGASVGQLKQLYHSLSEDMRSAYTGMDRVVFDKANLDMKHIFEAREQVLKPMVEAGLTPEKLFQMTGNEARLGATKLLNVRGQVDPAAWETYAGTVLQNMGINNSGEFNLATYATRWKGMPPEVQKALFANTPYADLPEAYHQLATVASRYKQAGVNYNYSESGNTINMAQMFSDFIKGGFSTVMGLGAGLGAHLSGLGGDTYNNIAAGSIAGLGIAHGVYKVGSAGAELITQNMLARMMTSPFFVKWAAAEVPAQAFPKYSNALVSYAASHSENLGPEVDAFLKYVKSKAPGLPNQSMHESGRGYALGGLTNTAQPNQLPEGTEKAGKIPTLENSPPQGTPPSYAPFLAKGYAEGGPAKMIPNKLQQIDKLTQDRLAAERGEKAAGSPSRSFSEIAKDELKGTSQKYAEGGQVDRSVNPEMWDAWAQVLASLDPSYDESNVQSPPSVNTIAGKNALLEEGINHVGQPDRDQFMIDLASKNNPKELGLSEGGNVVANENEPPGSLIDQFLNHNSSVIPFKTGAAGKYNNQDFMGYHMGTAHDPTSGTTMGFMDSVTPKDVLNYNPQKASTIWGNDMPIEPGKPANSNRQLPISDWNDIDDFAKNPWNGMAQGGAVDEDKMLNQIAHRESGGRNVMNYINDSKHTAGGIYQITNSTWKDFAPGSILSHWVRAIDAPPEVQRQVARLILKSPGGIHRWMDYNPKLAADIKGGNFGAPDTTQVASVGTSIDSFMGGPSNSAIEEEPNDNQEQIQQSKKQQLSKQALDDVPFAEPLTKYAIKNIWDNANV